MKELMKLMFPFFLIFLYSCPPYFFTMHPILNRASLDMPVTFMIDSIAIKIEKIGQPGMLAGEGYLFIKFKNLSYRDTILLEPSRFFSIIGTDTIRYFCEPNYEQNLIKINPRKKYKLYLFTVKKMPKTDSLTLYLEGIIIEDKEIELNPIHFIYRGAFRSEKIRM